MLLICISLILVLNLYSFALNKGEERLNSVLSLDGSKDIKHPVVLLLSEQYNPDQLYEQVANLSKSERREVALTTLKEFSANSQQRLRSRLSELHESGEISQPNYHWLYNAIGFNATPKALIALDRFDEISTIAYDSAPDVVYNNAVTQKESDSGNTRVIAWNLSRMNVPEVWELGYKGDGVLVAVIDSGLNILHTDIKDNLWTDMRYPNHGYNFMDNNHDISDQSGHGTHIAGTIASDGTSGTQCGIAPNAKIMALKVRPRGTTGDLQQSVVWKAMEFAIDHEADILNMSLGWVQLYVSDESRTAWRFAMQNTLNIGVLTAVAAGNENHNTMGTIIVPAICPPPWLHPDQIEKGGLSSTVAVGASAYNDRAATFTSAGPVTWEEIGPFYDYPLSNGSGLIRPDILAPGEGITSLSPTNSTEYGKMSGTSSATPNVVGVMALLLSKNNELTPEDISRILETTAKPLSAQKNNLNGSGRIDALAAINSVRIKEAPLPPFSPIPQNDQPAVSLTPTLEWFNGGFTDSYRVYLGTDNPPKDVLNGVEVLGNSYTVEECLYYNAKYYWRVDAVNQYGVTEGKLWSFVTSFPISESFETSDFSKYEWELSTTGANSEQWYITDEEAIDGEFSVRSGKIGHNGTTSLTVRVEILKDGVVSFYRKVSSEEKFDYLRFYIDNSLTGEWSGELPWEKMVFDVKAGIRSFRWVYAKDAMISIGDDSAWIDKIIFPFHFEPPVKYIPFNLDADQGLADLTLNWDVDINDNADPILFDLLGFNIYKQMDGEDDFSLVNEEAITELKFIEQVEEPGTYIYRVSALYWDTGKYEETDCSDPVYVTVHPPLSTPLFDQEPGVYDSELSLTIQPGDDTADVQIYYTLNGDAPDYQTAELYREPILIDESTTVKAKAYKKGHLPSDITSAEYEIILTNIEAEITASPLEFKVYPNPISLSTTARSFGPINISFNLSDLSTDSELSIYNIKGQLVKTYDSNQMRLGNNRLTWDLPTEQQGNVSAGIYLFRLKLGSKVIVRKIAVIN